MRLRNVSPMGDLEVSILARTIMADEVFEVTAAEAVSMGAPSVNFQPADGSPLTREHPRGIAGNWPTPIWWADAQGWFLLRLRCELCHKLAARFCVPARRGGLPAHNVAYALQVGRWLPTWDTRDSLEPVARHQYEPNRVSDPCRCVWSAWPTPTDAAMRTCLVKALNGAKPTPALGANRLASWRPGPPGAPAVTLRAHPG